MVERPASEGGPYIWSFLAWGAALEAKRAAAKRVKRGGACLLAHGLSSSDALRASCLRGKSPSVAECIRHDPSKLGVN
jgi:hypothetical protein